jgi:tripartite-type tricarboxylate transporter receptor subunit TctC
MKRRFARTLCIAVAAAAPLAAGAQSYPVKPVRLVVPFPAGGSADLTARLVAGKMSEKMGQPLVVDNRIGASGMIGSELVVRSAPDGYTILMTTSSSLISAVYLTRNPPYDPVRDFTAITAVADSATGLVVSPKLAIGSLAELIEQARRNPGKLTFSSSGIGSAFHLTGALFAHAAAAELTHVPYKGAGQALNDLMSGTIAMTFSTLGSQLPYIRSGKVKLIAVLDAQRYPAFPDVPAAAEALPGFVRPDSWMGFFAPAGLPPALMQRINAEIVATVNAPDVRKKLEDDGFSPIGNTPGEFASMVKSALEIYGRAVKAAGLKPE